MKSIRGVLGGAKRRIAQVATRALRQANKLLHPMRHRRVQTRLRDTRRPRSILVVCHGNLCRSPYLEALLRRMLPDITVQSGGFVNPGRPVPANAMVVASRRGLDLSAHRSHLIAKESLGNADLVIAMDARQAWHIAHRLGVGSARVIVAGDLDPEAGDSRTIKDPWQHPLEVFESTYARLDRCATVLAGALPRAASIRL